MNANTHNAAAVQKHSWGEYHSPGEHVCIALSHANACGFVAINHQKPVVAPTERPHAADSCHHEVFYLNANTYLLRGGCSKIVLKNEKEEAIGVTSDCGVLGLDGDGCCCCC